MDNHNHQDFPSYDAIIVGAGFSGMYMLYRLRERGLKVRVFEKGAGVGGAWYWSRYPGARCDSESHTYNFTFSETLYEEWSWRSRYPTQPEILEYLNFVADRLQLREDIELETEIRAAHFDEEITQWRVFLQDGRQLICKYFITAVGCLSAHAKNIPKIPGYSQYKGESYHTGTWPHHEVDFHGKKVGIIGNGSSGIQSLPVIAETAAEVYSFQRTPQYAIPAQNHPYTEEEINEYKAKRLDTRKKMFQSHTGYPFFSRPFSALEENQYKRQEVYETAWKKGGFEISATYNDLLINETSNETLSQFVRDKIKQVVKDQSLAEKLLPTYPIATKRLVLDTNYYESFNLPHVHFVDVKAAPITQFSEKGICTTGREYPLDMVVFATGYDGMTGPLLTMDIKGRGGESLKEKWEHGANVSTYLGVATNLFPNMFMITGPQSPSVATNMPTSIEQHVDWIDRFIAYIEAEGLEMVEANAQQEETWRIHCEEVYRQTLYSKTPSWYSGANVEGKPEAFLIYLGGLGQYGKILENCATSEYSGFDQHSSITKSM
ncbi:NAD(P)/FAD-dependent oxidoreductase [Cytobacillus kochii]|uniref:flavin-containing monooxygenase n=1 Tax=Cytobacillus kochii TaxID=859143 RepID=UPI001CD4A4CA|nr:NAD(P)/FAD-dependent oxidoreductase [Cytobacillus kochii]MCA1025979.1 NAD(P)/FAD-dependent oxidoreductase [Cytobacillus kochii]